MVEVKQADEPAIDGNKSTSENPISNQRLVDRINRSDRWMVMLTAVIAFGGIISACIFGQQLRVMQGQLEEMRDEQRAWVSGSISPHGPIIFNKNGVMAGLEFTLQNSGHLPATDVWVWAEILPFQNSQPPNLTNRPLYCSPKGEALAEAKKVYPPSGGTAFPGEVSKNDEMVASYGPGIDGIKIIQKYTRLGIRGCIRYRSVTGKFHYTGIAGLLLFSDGNRRDSLDFDPTISVDTAKIEIAPLPFSYAD
jgi:hypothetical protein